MTNFPNDTRESIISELLFYHAALGRGYVSPFPTTKGLVFSSALPFSAQEAMAEAEGMFRAWHDQQLAPERQQLAQIEESARNPALAMATGLNKEKVKEMRDRLNRFSHILWKEDQVAKSTVVELLKNHYYGSFTYFDAVGARLGASLSGSAKLAHDLGWATLTEGTTDQTFIRSNNTGGAAIHNLTGTKCIFNYFSACKDKQIERLRERVRDTPSGQVGEGTTIIIPGDPGVDTGVEAETLYSLMVRVFALGDKTEEDRVKVKFSHDSKQGWLEFINWQLRDLLEVSTPAAWQMKVARYSPISVRNATLFAGRAAMVGAFINAAQVNETPIRELELTAEHLATAKKFARLLYRRGSGHEGFERKTLNLKDARTNFITPQKLKVAKLAIEEALANAPDHRMSRTQIRRNVEGATLGLLDELTKSGDFVELRGVEECKMGKTMLAYTLPKYAPKGDAEAAVSDYEEAAQHYAEYPAAFPENDALIASNRIRERACQIFEEHRMPVVPLSRMSREERRILPRIVEMFPESFRLRGPMVGDPDPEILVNDDDSPLDGDGLNLWVRYDAKGAPFYNWKTVAKLKLDDRWSEDDGETKTGELTA